MAAVNRVTIESLRYPHCRADVEVAGKSKAGIVLTVRSGACYMQTYATHAELQALGEMLLRHADEGEVLEVAV